MEFIAKNSREGQKKGMTCLSPSRHEMFSRGPVGDKFIN